MCCQVEVSATGQFLIQRSPTEYMCVCVCVREREIDREREREREIRHNNKSHIQ